MLDILGKPIEVGSVLAHVSGHSSSISWGFGVVRELLVDGFRWDKVSSDFEYVNGKYQHTPRYRSSIIYRTDRCIHIPLTEEQLKAKHNIP